MAAVTEAERVRLLSVEQVAEALNVSTRSVCRFIERGELPAYRVGERLLRVSAEDLDTFLDRRVTAP